MRCTYRVKNKIDYFVYNKNGTFYYHVVFVTTDTLRTEVLSFCTDCTLMPFNGSYSYSINSLWVTKMGIRN